MEVGQVIKQRRLSLNISMNELARRAGIGQSGLSEIEAGKRSPNFDSLERIIGALGFSLSEFFAEDSQPDPAEAEILAAFRQLPDEKKEQAVRLVRAL